MPPGMKHRTRRNELDEGFEVSTGHEFTTELLTKSSVSEGMPTGTW